MELVETPVFTRQVEAALSDEGFLTLQWALVVAPEAGG